MAKRTVKIRQDDQTRSKIQAALIINRLQDCIAGKIELSAPQVSCAKILLNKVLPDLIATELSGTVTQLSFVIQAPSQLPQSQWEDRYADDPRNTTH